VRLLKSLLAVLTARWFVSLLGAVLLALLVWFFGPMVAIDGRAVLAPELNRLLVILGISVLWGLANLVSQRRARASGEAMVEAIAKPEPAAGAADPERAAVAARFAEALARLKVHRFRQGRLYELPWYLMIGPPGSGKTTALLQSGLRFPLERAQELKGVGGTRNCDWFFTDEAVLLDTAGRWTTQDSHQPADEAAWRGFLGLLAKHRPREPINGVIVAIAVDDLLAGDPGRLAVTARAVRARLAELGEHLGCSFPAYLVLTKADLIAGFRESFADLDERAREQVWGFTLPLQEQGGAPARDLVQRELDLLLDRLEGRLLARLEAERDPDRRALIQAFPLQVAALAAPLQQLLDEAFAATSYETPPILRGVYLTSATQAGTPIDRLLSGLQQRFGLRLGPIQALAGNRSFFLTRLLREVVFAEAPLARRASRLDRRDRRRTALSWSAAALAILVGLGGWLWSYLAQVRSVGSYAGALQTHAAQAAPIVPRTVGPLEEDLRPALPVLDRAAMLMTPAPATAPGLGLSQAGRLRAYGEEAYAAALERILLPRLIRRAETRLRAELAAPEAAAETLKVYLALGGQGELPPALVADWFAADWRRAYPLDEDLRRGLDRHLTALLGTLAATETRPALDGELVRAALAAIDRIPLSKRAYLAIAQKEGAEGEPLIPIRLAGPEAGALFAGGGSALSTPIPELYTRRGFWQRFLPALLPELRKVVADHAVLRPGKPGLDQAAQARIVREMLELYYKDTIDRWQKVERGLGLRLPASLSDTAAVLRPLAVPPSPLARVLQTLASETRLTTPPDPPAGGGTAADALAQTQAATGTLIRNALAALGEPVPPLGEPVEARFRPLARAVTAEGGAPAPLDLALQAANELYVALPPGGAPPSPAQSSQIRAQADRLATAAGDLPPPVKEPLQTLAGRVEGIAEGQVLTRINEEYRAKVLPFCRQAIGDRFPFSRGSPTDVGLADMARLFGAGGLFDQFAEQQLAPYVDMGRRPWRWLQPIGSPDGALAPFEAARRLRDGFFAGGAAPRAGFTLRPASLDPGASRVVLDLDGQTVSYAHGPVQPVHLDWPAPAGSRLVRLTFVPADGSTPVIRSKEGPWGWFRLLHEASLVPQGRPDLYAVTFAAGARQATFELLADSVDNPFDLGLFQRFRCPGGL
jgi:type VI secretion system protein ImpL